MPDNEVLEWAAMRTASPSRMFAESMKGVRTFIPYLFGGLLVAGVLLYMEHGELYLVLIMPGVALGILAIMAGLFAVVSLAMWLIGYGYYYRLDAEGFSINFFLGRGGGRASCIPAVHGERTIYCGPYSAWGLWAWLGSQGYVMTRDEPAGPIELRSQTWQAADSTKLSRICFFCKDREQADTVASFVRNHLK